MAIFLLATIGIIGLGIGLIFLFDKDMAWQWTSTNYKMQGVKTERTPQWDSNSNVTGVIMICVGLVMFGLLWSLHAGQQSAIPEAYINGIPLTANQAKAYRADPSGFLASFCSERPNACNGH